MSILSGITEGGVTGLFKGIGSLAKDVREAVTGKEVLSSEERLAILQKVSQIENAALNADVKVIEGQVEINKIEASSSSLYKSGWRPAVGWVCVSGLFYQFILLPLLPWTVKLFGLNVPSLPALDMSTLITLLGGMLGLGGMRTFEKVRGASK